MNVEIENVGWEDVVSVVLLVVWVMLLNARGVSL